MRNGGLRRGVLAGTSVAAGVVVAVITNVVTARPGWALGLALVVASGVWVCVEALRESGQTGQESVVQVPLVRFFARRGRIQDSSVRVRGGSGPTVVKTTADGGDVISSEVEVNGAADVEREARRGGTISGSGTTIS
jgi:hypothetical protein